MERTPTPTPPHKGEGEQAAPASGQPTAAHRQARASLVFAAGGGRTFLARQHVPYPFHITRPFHLDRARPDLATLYLQSASGGLYRGDRLGLAIAAREKSAAHVTTQAGTVVHDTGAAPARQNVHLDLAPDSFLALTTDPFILFPGAALTSATTIILAAGARAILTDGFTTHDPQGRDRTFGDIALSLTIRDDAGSIKVRERGALSGPAFQAAASPLGPFRACGTLLLLAPPALWPDSPALHQVFETHGCLAGASALPNDVGVQVRALAPDGGQLRAGLEAGFALAFTALTGIGPARRRK